MPRRCPDEATTGAPCRKYRSPVVLTDPFIKALKPALPGARYAVADALVPGLKVRVTDSGAKSFVLWRRYGGAKNPAARSLGKVGALTLVEAREKARLWLRQIAAGEDPGRIERRRREPDVKLVVLELQ
jgi:hypothetical protein